jgi:Ca2+-binding EF-hand superfamily protein
MVDIAVKMANKTQQQRRPAMGGRNGAKNMSTSLPDYLMEDLRDAFSLYEQEGGTIMMSQVRGILWNFGYWHMTKKDLDRELVSLDIDPRKPFLEWNEVLSLVTRRYSQGGKEQSVKETFKVFDKRERGHANYADIKHALQSHLEVGVTDADIQELYNLAGADPSGPMTLADFQHLLEQL